MNSDRPIGVIGLGEMGGTIARRILSVGHRVVGLDDAPDRPTPDSPLFERAAHPADVAARCDVVLLVVHTDEQVRDVVLGERGLAETARPGTVVVVHSTVDPSTCTALADALAGSGVALLDAGMSRGRGSMRDGVLTLFVGGDAATLEGARWALHLYSNNIVHAGPAGNGMVLKLCNNLLLHSHRLAMLEVAHIAATAGLPRGALLDGVRSSTGSSWVLEHWGSKDDDALADGIGSHPFVDRTTREIALALAYAGRLGLALPAITATGTHLPGVLTEGITTHLGTSTPAHEEAAPDGGVDDPVERQHVVDEYRANGGRLGGSRAGWEILLLTTTGARSGLPRTTPLAFQREGEDLFVFASDGGRDKAPDWYHNVRAQPKVTVELGTRTWEATAHELTGAERERVYARQVARDPQYARYARSTARVIPVLRLREARR
ncbi:nitroreductase/quinone reductase family protein [Streptomyces chumphonensis]|uniref:nitroreductase/quinone reductase family protein n=1 Tax=Streptomyces chumphonensis TaxID=1214925 RepID=UPI003D749972